MTGSGQPRPDQRRVRRIIDALRVGVRALEDTAMEKVQALSRDPFHVLIACLISLRTKDEVTEVSARRLFDLASTPEGLAGLTPRAIEQAIYPAGFYRTKAKNIREVARRIAAAGGRTPDTEEGLLVLPGVGRKTANLVLGLGHGIPAICVDTHVHRISNRLGWVLTRDPHGTERALAALLPCERWIEVNDLLVSWGKAVCRPQSPWCSRCVIRPDCRRVGVDRNR